MIGMTLVRFTCHINHLAFAAALSQLSHQHMTCYYYYYYVIVVDDDNLSSCRSFKALIENPILGIACMGWMQI